MPVKCSNDIPEMEGGCNIALRMMARAAQESKVHPLLAQFSELSESRVCKDRKEYFRHPLLYSR
ncbi:MAG: hypothetical protein DMG60_10665 [Acidobacteria bacterium]|nr:MAG: hypothetical protein DMG60_10665 [Acidobacteriota bacterium]